MFISPWTLIFITFNVITFIVLVDFGTIHLLLLATCIFRFIHADTGIYMHIHAIHADIYKNLRVCIWYVWVIYVYEYFCNTYSIHTHIKGGQSICGMYVYVLYVCAFIFCAYFEYIVHMLCILYVFLAACAKNARRKIQTRYIRYIQIHTHM